MTENEAIDVILKDHSTFKNPMSKAYVMACKALEEIQNYRALGALEEIQTIFAECTEYEAIGTIEEFKALKEKNTPMELAEHNFQDEPHHYLCPMCKNIVDYTQNYCEECGQALEG